MLRNRLAAVSKYFATGSCFVLGVLVAAGSSWGEEPSSAFLEKLRERRYYDMALAYLDRMEASPLADAEFKSVIEYERGVTLVKQAGATRDLTQRAKILDQAQQTLDAFLKKNSGHKLASATRSQLGNLIVERARMMVEKSRAPGAGNAPQLLQDAAKLYDEGFQVFQSSQTAIGEQLKGIPKVLNMQDRKQAALSEQRDQLRKDYLQVKLLAAAVLEEKADTAPAGAKEQKDLLLAAAKAYQEIYEDYRTYVAGLYARMYQGRCHQKMGDFKEALSFYTDLLEQPDEPDAFRAVKTKTLLLAMDCWLDPSQKKFAEAITQGSGWLDKARPNEANDPEWIALRLLVAKAYKQHGDSLAKTDKKRDDSFRQANVLARNVAKQEVASDLKKQAEEFLATLPNAAAASTRGAEEINPRNFAEARTAGNEAREEMTSAQTLVRILTPKIASENDAKAKGDLQQQVDDAQRQIAVKRDLAFKYYRKALELAPSDAEVALDDLNVVRYFLCYLHYLREEYYDAAVVGEFLARKFPSHVGAAPSSKIAMACYVKLYNLDPDRSRDFEAERLVSICDYITKTWPASGEASEALNTLIPFVINRGDLAGAERYLAQIPVDSPQRGDAELKTGQALWGAYLTGMAELRQWRRSAGEGEATPPPNVDLAAREKELEELKQRAQTTLVNGVERMRKTNKIDRVLASAVLSLAQVYVDTGQADLAIRELEDPQIGALTLVTKNDPATQREGYAQETYKTALRAYIGSLPTANNASAVMDKAKKIMEDLRREVLKDEAEGRAKLVAIYVSLAQSVRQSIDLAATDEAKNALSSGFETFLRQIGQESTDVNTLNWVAVTFQNLGEAFDDGRTPPAAKSLNYYKEAQATYEAMLKRDQADANFLEDKIAAHVMVELAKLKRRLGQYEDALKLFATVLKDPKNRNLLTVQVEAAQTYYERGRHDQAPYYKKAITGGYPDEKKQNIIWGWSRLSAIVQNRDEYRSYFFQARYNTAKALFDYGRQEKKPDDIELAKKFLLVTHQLYPHLGAPDAPEWQPKYTALLTDIQKALGEKPPYGFPKAETDKKAATQAAKR